MGVFKEYIIYTHTRSDITTIGQFLDDLGLSIARELTAKELLDYTVYPKNGDSISNGERVRSMYDSSDRETYLNSSGEQFVISRPLDTMPIYIGTRLAIPKDRAFTETALIDGYDQTEAISSIDNFLADNLKRLYSDPAYYPIDKVDLGGVQGVLNTQYPNVSVWVWCRSLSPEDADAIPIESRNSLAGSSESYAEGRRKLIRHFGIDGNLIDISPFIFNVQTSQDAGGGGFGFGLAPIEGERDRSVGWRPSEKTMQAISSKEFVAQTKMNKYNADTENIERSKFLFHKIIQPNDIVFIRFETLEGEDDRQDLGEEYDYLISKDKLAGRVYDMIGLVDQNSISTSASNQVDVSINIQGRDLMKLLQEDGAYFYPLAYTNYADSEYGDQKLLKRLSITGKYPLFGEYAYRSIQYSIEFIINQVSNISICPGNLFTSYGDRVSKTLEFDSATEEKTKEYLKTLKGEIEENIRTSRIVDEIALDDSTAERAKVVQAFDTLKKFHESIFAQKKIIYDTTTYSARSWEAGTYSGFPVNRGAFPLAFGQDLLYSSSKTTSEEISFSGADSQGNKIEFNKTQNSANKHITKANKLMFTYIQMQDNKILSHEPLPMPGIWQIVKLAFDPQIDPYRIADPSISQPDGPLLNQMNKICQEPFVEFYGDTYGDLFYFVARRPPYSQEAIRRFSSDYYKDANSGYFIPTEEQAKDDSIEGSEGGTNHVSVGGERRASFLIDIYEEDVMNESLSFYDGEVYSLFQIEPQAGFLGQGSEVSTGYIPIIQIPEYAEIWGAKRQKVVTQYVKFDGDWRLGHQVKENVIDQAGGDLAWMVETSACLPFTRQGRLTINGDRRIKRGTWIKYHPTGEIFYVTSVVQNYSISTNVDRTTTLTVERGMIQDFVEGSTVIDAAGDELFVSYFNIVDHKAIPKFVSSFMTDRARAGNIMSTFVNKKVLNFFLKRNQFKDNISREEEDTKY